MGPDLTPFQRDDTERMLLNIVAPSAEIREGFENTFVKTKDKSGGQLADSDSD